MLQGEVSIVRLNEGKERVGSNDTIGMFFHNHFAENKYESDQMRIVKAKQRS